jgi:hypothetical protein
MQLQRADVTAFVASLALKEMEANWPQIYLISACHSSCWSIHWMQMKL